MTSFGRQICTIKLTNMMVYLTCYKLKSSLSLYVHCKVNLFMFRCAVQRKQDVQNHFQISNYMVTIFRNALSNMWILKPDFCKLLLISMTTSHHKDINDNIAKYLFFRIIFKMTSRCQIVHGLILQHDGKNCLPLFMKCLIGNRFMLGTLILLLF